MGTPDSTPAFSLGHYSGNRNGVWSQEYARGARPELVLCCRTERLSEFADLFNAGTFQVVKLGRPDLETVLETVRSDMHVGDLAEKVNDYPPLQDLAQKPLYLQM